MIGMKLLTKQLEKQLPALYSQQEIEDPLVRAHFFNPCGQGDWWVIEGEWQGGEADPEGGPSPDDLHSDYVMFGLCCLFEPELGNVSLSELQSVRCPPFGLGIERDKFWTPKPLSEVRAEAESRYER